MKRETNEISQFWCDGWKIIDFNSMKKEGEKGGYRGTAGWSAPEINIHKGVISEFNYGADIFSLGLVILYGISGTHPLEVNKEQRDKCVKQKDLKGLE